MSTYHDGGDFRHNGNPLRGEVHKAMSKWHPDIEESGVTIAIVIAYAPKDADGNPNGPAISHGGYPALATIKITSAKDRAIGVADAIMTIDGDRIDSLSERELLAVIDHELTHLELRHDGEDVARDENERPRLLMRKHDRQFGWFDEVAKRHKEHAQEVKQAKELASGPCGQLYFAWMEEVA